MTPIAIGPEFFHDQKQKQKKNVRFRLLPLCVDSINKYKLYANADNKVSLLALCDNSKVFDIVSHSLLLCQCLKLNISPFWVHSYLSNWTQSLRINDTMSDKTNISCSVPQGSLLGLIR